MPFSPLLASLAAVLLQAAPSLGAAPEAAVPDTLTLLGVVVSQDPARSTALLRAEGRTRAASTGETAFGARVMAIAADRVVMEAGGVERELRLAHEPPVPLLAPTAAAPVAPAASEPVLVEDKPGVRTLDRADIERRLMREIPRILAETALLPVSDGGNVTGFTLARLPDGTVLSEVGLQAGDVLTEINGTQIDSLPTLASLYGRLSSQNEIRAVVLRGGSLQTLTVRLR